MPPLSPGAGGRIRRKNLDRPDSVRTFPNGEGQLTRVGPVAIGRGLLRPGWRWSTDIRPMVGTRSCEIHHLQLLLAGRFAVRMDDGEEVELVPGDVFEVPPGHDAWVVGDEPVSLIDVYGNIEDFALPVSPDRALLTLLMTDIVDSTATAERIGDAAWEQALAGHNRAIRTELTRHNGREVKTTGDGFLATFASPNSAVRCAAAIAATIRDLGIEVRIGLHTGEVEVREDDVGGIAVHTVARIMSLAGRSEILVSAITRSLVEGADLRFEDRGRHDLKGLADPVAVAALVG